MASLPAMCSGRCIIAIMSFSVRVVWWMMAATRKRFRTSKSQMKSPTS